MGEVQYVCAMGGDGEVQYVCAMGGDGRRRYSMYV